MQLKHTAHRVSRLVTRKNSNLAVLPVLGATRSRAHLGPTDSSYDAWPVGRSYHFIKGVWNGKLQDEQPETAQLK